MYCKFAGKSKKRKKTRQSDLARFLRFINDLIFVIFLKNFSWKRGEIVVIYTRTTICREGVTCCAEQESE